MCKYLFGFCSSVEMENSNVNESSVHVCENLKKKKEDNSAPQNWKNPPNNHGILAVGVCRFQLGNNVRKGRNENGFFFLSFIQLC